ncbi:hypothetical protein ACFOHT_00830 [Massilia oculi]|uniref:hypothetical protein n=1 Tax=Massilia oculi TaxID=945844 RepID=UPI0013B432F1|nr:hypothetical protein [Massilia oculi]
MTDFQLPAKRGSEPRIGGNASVTDNHTTSADQSASDESAQEDRCWIKPAKKKARRSEPFQT